jgi:hypothetical protein
MLSIITETHLPKSGISTAVMLVIKLRYEILDVRFANDIKIS